MDRSVIKGNAWETVKKYYWKAVLISLLLSVFCVSVSNNGFSGGGGGGSNRRHSNSHDVSYTKSSEVIDESHSLFTVMANAVNTDSGVYRVALLVVLVLTIIWSVICWVFGSAFSMGGNRYMLSMLHGKETHASDIVFAFKQPRLWLKAIGAILFVTFLTVLGVLLFIVPGIIISIMYRLTVPILAENPELSIAEAMNLSKKMMDGHKWSYFVLILTTIGWILLAAIPIAGWLAAVFWITPYLRMIYVSAYDYLAADYRNSAGELCTDNQYVSEKPLSFGSYQF